MKGAFFLFHRVTFYYFLYKQVLVNQYNLKTLIMGLFNIFKTSEQKKNQETISQLRKEIFPGGKQQQEQEVQEVRKLLNFKYSMDATEYSYVFAVISYFTSENPETNEIVEAVLRNTKSTVTREDAEKICAFIALKRAYKPTDSLGKTLKKLSHGEKLFMIVFGAIVEIKRAYKDLTNYGKYEVLLFNSMIALQEFQSSYPEKYEDMKPVFFKKLFNQAKVYGISMNTDELVHFVSSRFETYIDEIIRFFDEDEEGFLLLKTYTLFYEQPLEPNPEKSFDFVEYASFQPALMQMRNYVIEKTFTMF